MEMSPKFLIEMRMLHWWKVSQELLATIIATTGRRPDATWRRPV